MTRKYNRWQLIGGYIVVIGLVGLAALIIVKTWLLFWDFISRANPTVGAAIIAASGTILISVFTLVWNRRSERQKEIEERRHEIELEIREKKLPIYGELVAFFFKVFNASKTGTQITEAEMNDFFVKFTEKTVIWGSDRFIQAFSNFRDGAITQAQSGNNQQPDPTAMMVNFENLLYAIRADYGHENTGLGSGDLLALFINDIRDYIKKQQ